MIWGIAFGSHIANAAEKYDEDKERKLLMRDLDKKFVPFFCSKDSAYLSCLKIDNVNCQINMKSIMKICTKKLSSSIPNTQSDMEKVNRFFNRYTSCLIKEHRRYYQLEESTVDSCVTIPVPTK